MIAIAKIVIQVTGLLFQVEFLSFYYQPHLCIDIIIMNHAVYFIAGPEQLVRLIRLIRQMPHRFSEALCMSQSEIINLCIINQLVTLVFYMATLVPL